MVFRARWGFLISFAGTAFSGDFSTSKLLLVDFARPEPVESNAKLWFSLNQAFGHAGLMAGRAGGDAHWVGRIGQFLSLAYLNLAIGHYSHELGHNIHSRDWGLDWNDWSAWPWPRFEHGRCDPEWCVYDPEWWPRYPVWPDWATQKTAGGLNMEEYDAYFMHKHSADGMSFDEGMAFTFRKLSTIAYDLYTGRVFGHNRSGDLSVYKSDLRAKGMNISGPSLFFQAALSDALTFRLWESLSANWNYLRNGIRERRSFSFGAAGWEILPPLVNYYLTPNGGFYDFTVLGKTRDDRGLEAHLGWDADLLGGSRVNRIRLGAEETLRFAHESGRPAEIAPFAYVSLRRRTFATAGWHAGVRILAPLIAGLGFTGRAEYSSGDVLENTVKWKSGGFGAALGMVWAL